MGACDDRCKRHKDGTRGKKKGHRWRSPIPAVQTPIFLGFHKKIIQVGKSTILSRFAGLHPLSILFWRKKLSVLGGSFILVIFKTKFWGNLSGRFWDSWQLRSSIITLLVIQGTHGKPIQFFGFCCTEIRVYQCFVNFAASFVSNDANEEKVVITIEMWRIDLYRNPHK